MNVSTLGLMRESASQRTMVSSKTPHARPKALVQDRFGESAILGFCLFRTGLIVDRDQFQDLKFPLAIRRDYGRLVADFLV
jgi:hypothetical protein